MEPEAAFDPKEDMEVTVPKLAAPGREYSWTVLVFKFVVVVKKPA
jgi:hypothetical protein